MTITTIADRRDLERHPVRREVPRLLARERPGVARDRAGDRERGELVERHVVAERGHPPLVLADPGERAPERREDDEPERRVADEEDAERVPVEVVAPSASQLRAAGERRDGDPVDAVRAAGQRRPVQREHPEQLPERERQHQEVDAARAHGEDAGHERDAGRDAGRDERSAANAFVVACRASRPAAYAPTPK